MPPAPWTNVVAHETFGFACTESGPGYTWSDNSHDNRLTPWRNDPVSDAPGEAVFIRDEDSGAFWSATPLPAGRRERYTTRHGQGYSIYEHARGDIASELTLFVPRGNDVKVFRLALKNAGSARRRLSVTLYAEWVLGENRDRTAIHVVTGVEPVTGAVLATNRFRPEFPATSRSWISPPRPRTTAAPSPGTAPSSSAATACCAARPRSGATRSRTASGPGHDPCGAIRVHVDLAPSQQTVVIGLLGDAANEDQVREVVQRYRDPAAVDAALADVRQFWDGVLGTMTVRTPDRAMDLLLNRWLLYQTLACRIWGRSAFYQSSGAFGFRDQLQDTLALTASVPAIPRAHLLHAASRQFARGGRSALVARAGRPGRAHALLRRSAVAAVRRAALHPRHRRRRRARRDGAVPDRPRAEPRRARGLRAARDLIRIGDALRALRPRDRDQPGDRRPRPAADGHRRLERRHEPGRRRRQGRERLARLVPGVDPAAVRRSRRDARRRRARGEVSRRGSRAHRGRRGGVGRRMVSPRVLRRWHAARIEDEHGMPDRRDRAVVVGDLGRRRSGARAPGDGVGGRAARPPRRRARRCC